jgi:hypothetical protein
MLHRARRTLVVLLTLLPLALPLTAQPGRERAGAAVPDFLTAVWNRLTAPLSALWAPDSGTGAAAPAPPEATPPPVVDGRSVIDPIG